MAARTDLQSKRSAPGGPQQDGEAKPGLWKLVAAAAAILVLLVSAMEAFKETEVTEVHESSEQRATP